VLRVWLKQYSAYLARKSSTVSTTVGGGEEETPLKDILRPGVVVLYTYNSSTQESKAGGLQI
jgi:hypothetical protein